MFSQQIVSSVLVILSVVNCGFADEGAPLGGVHPAYHALSLDSEAKQFEENHNKPSLDESVAPAYYGTNYCDGSYCGFSASSCCGTNCCSSGYQCCDSYNDCISCSYYYDDFISIDDNLYYLWQCDGSYCEYQGGTSLKPNGCCGYTCCYDDNYCCSYGSCVECYNWDDDSIKKASQIAAGVIIAIAVGSICGCVVIAVAIWYCIYRCARASSYAPPSTPVVTTAVQMQPMQQPQYVMVGQPQGAGVPAAGYGFASATSQFGAPPAGYNAYAPQVPSQQQQMYAVAPSAPLASSM